MQLVLYGLTTGDEQAGMLPALPVLSQQKAPTCMALHCFLGAAQQRLLCLPRLLAQRGLRRPLDVAHQQASRQRQRFQLGGGEGPGLGVCHYQGAVHRASSRPIS